VLVKLVPLLITLAIIAFAMLVYFITEVMLFRLSCGFARVPRPTLTRSIIVVFTLLLTVFVIEGAIGAIVRAAHQAGGFPLWEAGLVAFFIGLPFHMMICSMLHARMTQQRISDGLAVWFVEKTIKLAIGLIAISFFALIVFAKR